MIEFHDVLITPYTELLDTPRGLSYHRGGPAWPEWDKQHEARHCVGGQPVDHRPEPPEGKPALADEMVWCGAIFPHFGHQVADFSMRILMSLTERPEATFAFSSHPRFEISTLASAPTYFAQILDLFGVPRRQVRVITSPTRVHHLAVVAQAEQVDEPDPERYRPEVGPSAEHLNALDELDRQRMGRLARSGVLYVSRAGQHARFAGEAFLEESFHAAGVRVLRPEQLSLVEQLRAYASAQRVVFAEGSAIHGTKLIGRAIGEVIVLARRTGPRFAERSLAPRAQSLTYLDAASGLVYPSHPSNEPAYDRGLSIIDKDRLVSGLDSVGINISRHWDDVAFTAARDADVLRWVDEERTTDRGEIPGTTRMVQQSLADSGLEHLAERTATLLATKPRRRPAHSGLLRLGRLRTRVMRRLR